MPDKEEIFILLNLGLGTAATKNVGTGSGQIPDMSSFVFNLGGNGAAYNWFPGGNLLQMGRANTSASGQQIVNIPLPYPRGNFNVVAIAMDQSVPNIISAAGLNASQIAINAWGANSTSLLGQRVSTPVFWLTFGN
ncbi:gp53-like domain-containing protein [Enterobacter roggenkampii]|uniref:gp53-like domain-containing protein n=2 Tax=Enterobacter roggenkampii TaxID=1812935 RepID=UPI003BEF09C9